MVVSYALVRALVLTLPLNVLSAKLLVETTLFVASFSIQNQLIFRTRAGERPAAASTTDWEAYYAGPYATARLTRRVTERWRLRVLARAFPGKGPVEICELGGGNSCVLTAVARAFPGARYRVIDNNACGLDLLRGRSAADRAAIRAHFRLVKPGGLVAITYPTPTWLYRIIRSASEALGLWLFHDERPLTAEEVLTTVTPLGRVVSTGTNWLVGLTQGYVVARAPADCGAAPEGRC